MEDQTTRQLFDGKLIELLERGIKAKDSSRMHLIRIPLELAQNAWSSLSLAELSRVRNLIEVDLFRMIGLALASDDFDLFRAVVHGASTMLISLEPIEYIHSKLNSKLFQWAGPRPLLLEKIDGLGFLITFKTGIDHGMILELPKIVNSMFGPPEKTEILADFTRDVRSLYVKSLLLGAFFMAGVDIIFRHYQNKTDANSYLFELWHHTAPTDTDNVYANKPPVPKSPLWLTQYFLYGGRRDNDLWYDSFQFQEFHGVEKYVIEYYLLALAKLGVDIPLPSNTLIEKLAKANDFPALESFYRFARDFLNSTGTERFQSVLEAIDDRGYDQFVRIGKDESIDARDWKRKLKLVIDKARTELQSISQLIQVRLPLDQTKLENCTKKIMQAYRERSFIDTLAVANPQVDSDHRFKDFSVGQRAPRECFIGPAAVDCSLLWFDAGSEVADRQNSYIFDALSRTSRFHSILEEYDPLKIYETMYKMSQEMEAVNRKPTGAIASVNLESDLALIGKLVYEDKPAINLHGGPIPLQTLLQEHSAAILVHKQSCKWLFDPIHGSVVGVDFDVSERNPTEVEVKTRSYADLEFDPNGIAIIEFPAQKKLR